MTAESCPGREVPGGRKRIENEGSAEEMRPKADMEQRTRGNDEAESGYGTREPAEK